MGSTLENILMICVFIAVILIIIVAIDIAAITKAEIKELDKYIEQGDEDESNSRW